MQGAEGISVSMGVLTRGCGQYFYVTSGFPFTTASGQNADQCWAITTITNSTPGRGSARNICILRKEKRNF